MLPCNMRMLGPITTTVAVVLAAVLLTQPRVGNATEVRAVQATALPCGPVAPDGPLIGHMRTLRLGFHPVALAVSELDGHVFAVGNDACTGDGRIAMLDASSGRILRTGVVGRYPTQVAIDEPIHRLFVLTGWVYPGAVSIIDTRSGSVLSATSLGQPVARMVVSSRARRVFVASWAQTTFVLDAMSGQLLRSVPVGGKALAVDDALSRVYATAGTRLRILDARTGSVIQTVQVTSCRGLDGVNQAEVDSRASRLFLGSAGEPGKGGAGLSGHICVLDASSGKVLHAIDAGPGVSIDLLPVDAAVGAVLVAERDYLQALGHVDLRDARDGRVVRHLGPLGYSLGQGQVVGQSPTPSVDSRTGRIYGVMTTAPHRVVVLYPRGWRQRVIARHLHGNILAVAIRAHRLYLADQSQGTLAVLPA